MTVTARQRHTLGARLHTLRTRAGLRQQDVADVLNLPRTAIAMIEGGHRSVSLDEAVRLADLFTIALDTLAGRQGANGDPIAAERVGFENGWKAGRAELKIAVRATLELADGRVTHV